MAGGFISRIALVLVPAVLLPGCKQARAPDPAAARSRVPVAAQRDGGTRDAAAVASAAPGERLREYAGPRVLGVPLFHGFAPEDSLQAVMRRAWEATGENPALFELRVGERILSTDAPFDDVRAFYLPYVSQVFMDHEMEDVAGIGHQRMFTGLMEAPDGTLVKLTLTRPYFPFTSPQPIDRTFLQIGTVGARPNP